MTAIDVEVQVAPPTFQVVSVLPTGPRGPAGAVDSVVAGDHVNVDATDPANPEVSVDATSLASDAALTGAFAPVTTTIAVFAREWQPWIGTPAMTTIGGAAGWPAMSFDPSSDERATLAVWLPPGWDSYDVDLWWSVNNPSGGNVAWRIQHAEAAVGEDFDVPGTTTTVVFAASPTDDMAQGTRLASGIAHTEGKMVRIVLWRDADNAGDTETADALAVAVVLGKA